MKSISTGRKIVIILVAAGLLMALMAGTALAQEEEAAPGGLAEVAVNLDATWVLIAAALVFFMQAGFFFLEGGLTRSKNVSNAMMKGAMDFCFGALVYWAIGYAIMFGTSRGGFTGSSGFFLNMSNALTPDKGNIYAFLLFQIAFAGAAATILAGGVAERFKFSAYIIATIAITGLIYPFVGHWIWGGGWLSDLGFVDFAGSTVVHSVGGWCALVGAFLVGPRLGKYRKDGKPNAIPGHSIPMAALGTFILWLGWFGFNPGSTLKAIPAAAIIAVNTTLAGAAGGVVNTFVTWKRYGKPDVSMAMNGILAGLVAVTAGCAVVSPAIAVAIGTVAGVLVVFSVEFIDKVLKVDDPVGAISVHAANGIWGTIAVGLFAQSSFAEASGLAPVDGLFFGGGFKQLGIQLLGVVAVGAWAVLTSGTLFLIMKKTMGIRVTDKMQLDGLDIAEHNVEAYPEFLISAEGGVALEEG